MTTRYPALLLAAALFSVGCRKPAPPAAEPKPPQVEVAYPDVREVVEYEEFTGRLEASAYVELRAQVSGQVEKLHFKDGADVKKGQLLFTLDARPFEAEEERLLAQVSDAEAKLERLASEDRRIRMLRTGGSGAASAEEAEKIRSERAQAQASITGAKAGLKTARLNLEYSRIVAPNDGRVSRRMVDPGNTIKAGDTKLTTLVALDPLHAYFDIDERTVLRLRRLIGEGKLQSARTAPIPVKLGLADQQGFPIGGVIEFVDNVLDAGTGTLKIRARIRNERELLSPGMFIRLRLPVSLPAVAAMVPEAALVADQGQKFLYVVDEKNKVAYRQVEVGQLQDGMRIVKKGVTAKDRVIVEGQQRVKAEMEVAPKFKEAEKTQATKGEPK